jgi:hypothetical protein
MKRFNSIRIWSLLSVLALTAAFQTQAALAEDGEPATLSSIKIDDAPFNSSSASDQLFTFSLGSFQPSSVVVSNGSYQFDYGSRPTSFQAQASWALKLADLAGGLYVETTLAFSTFSGTAIQNPGSQLTSSSYGLGLFGLDARMMYAGAWFPWKPLVPFVDAGYRYSVFYQPGASGLESAEGGVGNPVAGAGLRLWLNRHASMGGSTPLYLTAKVDRIFPVDQNVNLASTTLYGGIAIGL